MYKRWVIGAVIVVVGGAGCGGAPTRAQTTRTVRTASNPPPSCQRTRPGVGAARADAVRQGSTVALAQLRGEMIAYVSDEDGRAIRTVDVERATSLGVTPLGAVPAQLVVLDDGRVAVTLRDTNQIAVLEPAREATEPLAELCRIDAPVEPFGLAVTPDDASVLVTSIWDSTLSVFDAHTFERKRSATIAREPRAVVVDDDGSRAFVSHVVGGKMSVVDLTSSSPEVREIDLRVKRVAPTPSRRGHDELLRSGGQGFALAKAIEMPKDEPAAEGRPKVTVKAPNTPAATAPRTRVFAPMVSVEPGDPNTRTAAYYGEVFDGVAREAPIVSVVDTGSERALTRSIVSLGARTSEECILPRSAAVDPASGALFVTCLGVDALVELDTRGLDPARLERRRWTVAAGPTGVAIEPRGQRAVVWSQFDHTVSVVDLAAPRDHAAVKTVALTPELPPSTYARGRRLFHATDDPRIASDGIACASCHPDGREDSLTWATPDGPRQTIMLAGRVEGTGPYGWMGKHETLHTYVTNTFTRLGGSGLNGDDLDALLTYVTEVRGPALRAVAASDAVARGRTLFFDAQAGCSSCHLGASGTDSEHHDIGSKAIADVTKEFDTPSLRFVRGTAPYFHDGRYRTLRELLSAQDHAMGFTAHLSRRDALALEAFLETL